MPTYLDYQPLPNDNQSAPPIGAPEGSFQGKWVNDIARYMMSVIRNLGDAVPKLGVGMAAATTIGTMATQDADDVAITGGTISGATIGGVGAIPIKGIIPYGGTAVQAAALEASGWAICDGRTVNSITTPDLRSLFLRSYSGSIVEGSTGGSLSAVTSSSNGAHNHSGSSVAGHALTEAELAAHRHFEFVNATSSNDLDTAVTGVTKSGTSGVDSEYTMCKGGTDATLGRTSETGSGNSHSHGLTIASDGAHTHTVTPAAPPWFSIIYLMRVA